MVDDVLVDRRARRDEDGHARALPTAGSPELLPGRRDRARVAGQDRDVEPADVDAQLERVRGDDAEDLAVAQAVLDGPTLGRQVAAAVAADAAARSAALAERFAQAGQQQLDRDPRATEDDRLATGPQERQGPALGEGQRPTRARPLAGSRMGGSTSTTCRSPAGAPFRSMSRDGRPVSIAASSPGFPIVAEQHTMTGLAAVVGADPEQPAQDVGDVAAEDAAVRVQLVDDDDRSCSKSWNHFVWWGRIAEWSMSGFVTTT